MKDWCTGFPEHWVNWKFKKIYIGDCCKIHDIAESEKGCSSSGFAKCLIKKKVLGGFTIWTIATIACWVKYPIHMFKRL